VTDDMTGRSADMPSPLIVGLQMSLCLIRDAVAALNDDAYAGPSPRAFDGGVGQHVRHCLDHVAALLAGVELGVTDYDQRERGGAVERDRQVGLVAIDESVDALSTLDDAMLDRPMDVHLLTSPQLPAAKTQSTVARELAFVMSHTIHHGAIIKSIILATGGSPPTALGMAPATLASMADEQ